jgi:anti-sigma factor ChrR (cupin superfamily)
VTTPKQPDADELAALSLAGALPEPEAAAFDAELTRVPEGAAALRDLGNAVRALVAEIEPVAPAPSLKQSILAALPKEAPRSADRAAAAKLPGFEFRFTDDDAFKPTPYPGVSVRMLHVDKDRKQFACLMRLEPGAVYPCHPHDGPEECIVLEGEIFVGDVKMRRGDYQRAEPGTQHIEQRSETGALLFITAPVSLMRR